MSSERGTNPVDSGSPGWAKIVAAQPARGQGADYARNSGRGAEAEPGAAGSVPSLLPAISLPKGGGAIRGIGEKFSTNPATGTASLSIPIATSPGRAGFELGLSLTYDSGSGNGPFGLGWHLSTPAITRKTDRGLPRYLDDADSDVFVLSGAEDLVPVPLDLPDGTQKPEGDATENGERYRVRRYRPRTEGLFARIERWTRVSDADAHWRVITRDNVLNIYGRNLDARIADPRPDRNDQSKHPAEGRDARVFSWLLDETRDDRGNIARYSYKAEDGSGVDRATTSESNRFDEAPDGTTRFLATAQRYIKRISYGNRRQVDDRTELAPPENDPAKPTSEANWLFEVVFDYGEHDPLAPTPWDDKDSDGRKRTWTARPDPFSSYRAAFEVRTFRRCRRVLMFHWFKELGATPCLVRSTDFAFDPLSDAPGDAGWPIVTYLASATQAGYKRDAVSGKYERATLPPLDLGYVKPKDVFSDELRSLDRESLEGIPRGVEGSGGQWVDLDGEGIPGVLIPTERAWYYKENRGSGQLAPPRLERTLPSPAELGSGAQQLTDLGGDGNLDLVRYARPLSGYFERTSDRGWAPFVSLGQIPNIDWHDPNLRFLDMDGDGFPDILITEHDAFVWYRSRGKEGFDPAVFAPKPKDELTGPAVIFADGTETIQLADMSGDGLVDIVRVRNGEVCYWPNLGYGRFGRKVTIDRSPRFDSPDQFDPKRVRLADIDGSGTTDVIYLGRDGVRLYFNQSGNVLTEGKTVTSLPPVDSAANLSVVDLLGQGTACLVWSSPLQANQARPVMYVDLMGSTKPHLLTSMKNNFGAETRIAYAASTKFYLEDKEAGRPWLTRLAFPVHVIERIERVDKVAKSKLVTRFAYHHGHFDGLEREFRGFARVEQWDAETLSGDKGKGLFPEFPYDVDPSDNDLNLPPVRTVTWFHTGAWLERERFEVALAKEYYDKDAQAPLLPDTPPLPGPSVRDEREAARALRGQVLRQEVYAEDLSPAAAHPYTVSERSYEIRQIRPVGGSTHAIVFVHPSQTVTIQYERKPNDPRVQQEVVLAVDDFGQVTTSTTIAYPRRDAERQKEEATTGRKLEEQTHPWATLVERTFANRPFEKGWYRASVPTSAKTSELTGLPLPAQGLVDAGALRIAIDKAAEIQFHAEPTGVGIEKRVVEWENRFYYAEHSSLDEYRADDDGLSLGKITERALLHHVERFAFTAPFVGQVYRGAIGDMVLRNAGYGQDDNDDWWARSGRAVPDPLGFYLPVEAVDPFRCWTAVTYDANRVLPTEAKEPRVEGDALDGQVDRGDRQARFGSITCSTPDYRVLAPNVVVDSNGNETEVRFNALGLPEELWRKPGDQHAPSVVFRYDFHAWAREKKPTWSHTARRTEHDQGGAPFAIATTNPIQESQGTRLSAYLHWCGRGRPLNDDWVDWFWAERGIDDNVAHLGKPTRQGWLHSRVYADGSGREAMTKAMAEPGPVPTFDSPGHLERNAEGKPETHDVDDRWVGTGRTVFDNKGNPIKKYEPFFSETIAYEDEQELLEWGVTPVLHYDPVGRLVRTDQPNGTFSRIELDAWTTRTWDENDTVRESAWYAKRGSPDPTQPEPTKSPARRAAWLAAQHADTFSSAHLDAMGRAFLSVADNGAAGKRATCVKFDIKGNQLRLTDPRGVRALEQTFDALGRKARVNSADAGESRTLLDVFDKPVLTFDPRGYVLSRSYDSLRRSCLLSVTDPQGTARLAECVLYGELNPQAASNNLRGRPHKIYDGAGELTNEVFDFKGNLERVSRRLAKDYKGSLDWTPPPPPTGVAFPSAVTQNAPELLETEVFETGTSHDALDRITSRTTPDKKVTVPTYNDANLLESVMVDSDQCVRNIDYNERGQRLVVEYGNGTQTAYEYDQETFRLIRQITAGACGNGTLQDLAYEYDPVGNITQIIDRVSFGRRAHAPDVGAEADLRLRLAAGYADRVFAYDSIYQLVDARGRHRSGQQAGPADAAVGAFVHPNDPQNLKPYRQTFAYDAAGNLVQMSCRAQVCSAVGWTRPYEYAPDSNRLLKTGAPGDPPGTLSATYTHDAAGNMTRMPHLPRMFWDYANRLQHVEKQVQNDAARANDVYFTYDSGGQRVRKVYEHGGLIEERIYLSGYEVYRKRSLPGVSAELERQTLHVMDGEHRIAMLETKTSENGTDVVAPERRLRYELEDHLMSSMMELDGSGEPFSYEEFYPYGETSHRTASAAFGGSAKRYRYNGKERDEETSLYYYGARYYAAWLGRWTAPDPVNSNPELGKYSFARNNPFKFIDPDGCEERELSQEDVVLSSTKQYLMEKGIPFAEQVSFDVAGKDGRVIRGRIDLVFPDPATGRLRFIEGKGHEESPKTENQQVYHPYLMQGVEVRVVGKNGGSLNLQPGKAYRPEFQIVSADNFAALRAEMASYPNVRRLAMVMKGGVTRFIDRQQAEREFASETPKVSRAPQSLRGPRAAGVLAGVALLLQWATGWAAEATEDKAAEAAQQALDAALPNINAYRFENPDKGVLVCSVFNRSEMAEGTSTTTYGRQDITYGSSTEAEATRAYERTPSISADRGRFVGRTRSCVWMRPLSQ